MNNDFTCISCLKIESQQPMEIREEDKFDFVNVLPLDIIYEIFSYLNANELARCFRISKQWKTLANHDPLWNALTPKNAFGKKQWEKYFGDVGIAPLLPRDIHKILKAPCPFFKGKKVEETHMLVLIPETIDGKALNLKTLGDLIKAPKAYPNIYLRNEVSNNASNVYHALPAKSHWTLMTTNVIEGSRDKNIMEHQNLVTKFSKESGTIYEVPNVLDTAICIYMYYMDKRKRLFNDMWGNGYTCTYTTCQEENGFYRVVVGNFSASGLSIDGRIFTYESVGVAAMRKFF